ncbi:MAG: type I-E CRISPR-associated protein Cse1/CasA [Alistipes senegalensis]|nr:type I-E CRISPR-associated protein Cse1/CasA [Alistipes senegalensis]
MESEFNLIDESWICVRMNDMTIKEVSLKDLFLNAHNYKSLAGETKSQDFAVLRFLLAIIHTVFSRYDINGDDETNYDNDCNLEKWNDIFKSGFIPEKPIKRYFEEWYDHFWLFDENFPFYQSNAVNGKCTYCSTLKMIGSLFESANKKRLFSERMHKKKESINITYSEAARWLLHIHCFDDIAAKDEKKKVPKRTWVGKLSLIAIQGENLFETLMLNYNAVCDAENGIYKSRPSWENDNNLNGFNNLISVPDNQADLLSLQSRRVYLCRENGMVSGYNIFGGDYFEEDDVIAEQMTLWKSYQEKKVDKYKPRLYDTSKMAWQEFNNIAAFNEEQSDDDNKRTPGIIKWIKTLIDNNILDEDYMVKITMSAVIYDYGQATSLPVIDVVSDNLIFHSHLLSNINFNWRICISEEIERCNEAAKQIYILYKNLQYACGRKDKDGKTEQSGEQNAKIQFYDMIDHHFRIWLAGLNPENCCMDEYRGKLESKLKKIALRLGNELTSQISGTAIFGQYVKDSKDKKSNEILSSAAALNIFHSKINKIFSKAGDYENEQK